MPDDTFPLVATWAAALTTAVEEEDEEEEEEEGDDEEEEEEEEEAKNETRSRMIRNRESRDDVKNVFLVVFLEGGGGFGSVAGITTVAALSAAATSVRGRAMTGRRLRTSF